MRLTAKTSPILGTNPKTRTLHIMLQFCRTARQMLANSQHILIVHTKKEANCVAHRLSRLAFTTSERYWMEDVSSQLSFDVQHDLGTIFVPERQYPTVIEELCHKFSLADLRKSTNNFHHKRRIERGGFGIVYKVFLQRDNGSYYTVEIKRIYEEVFRNEIELLCQLRHPNLVSLIGFCNDLNEKIIVYEYMSNGSLHQLLQSGILSWKKRLELCIGAARGLHYLHAGAKRTIIHRHIKPSNILLDDNMEPKLAGFDLSIQGAHFMSKPKLIQVPAVGTYGYVAMEVWTDDTVTDKTDVYSFGMVLLEVVCGRKYLMEPIETEFLEKPLEEKIDEIIEGSIAPECWQVFADITLRCVKLEPDERPTMGEVEVELEYALSLQKQADRAKYPLFSTTIFPPPPPLHLIPASWDLRTLHD